MTAYYNEIDPYAAQWLRELIRQGYIADGTISGAERPKIATERRVSYETGEYSIPPIVTLACQWLDSQAPAGEHAAPVAYRRARKRTGT